MSHEVTCAGLPASWINAWLAAVGATVLDSRIRLHWSETVRPVAVFSAVNINPIDALFESWPTKEFLDDLPIAKNWREDRPVGRKVSVEDFIQRTSIARGHPYSWTLSSTMTDLCVNKEGEVEHAPFDPGVPKGRSLHDRLLTLQTCFEISEKCIHESFMGIAQRVKINGLGFDGTRLGSSADKTEKYTDPIIEMLAFFGLKLFPVRGNGIDQRYDPSTHTGKRQRGWKASSRNPKILRFHWPAWSQPLDINGIDALMDKWNPTSRRSTWEKFGIHQGWKSVKFSPTSLADTTRAYGSERL